MEPANNAIAPKNHPTQNIASRISQMEPANNVTVPKNNLAQNIASGINQKTFSIFVNGFRKGTKPEKLLQYFSKFGTITRHIFGGYYIQINFQRNTDMIKIFETKHVLDTRLLVRTSCPKKPRKKKNNNKEAPKSTVIDVTGQLYNLRNFDEEVKMFLRILQPADRPCPHQLVITDITQAIKMKFPAHTIYTFGSNITGLGFLGSDLDVHIAGVRTDWDMGKTLGQITGCLSRLKAFHKLVLIKTASTPIIKCVHTKTNTACDINIKSMLGVSNSRLIKWYLDVNPLLRQAMLIIKYWSKKHGISGVVNTFTSYSLCLLFIFYLQGAYKFSSVKDLQVGTTPLPNQEGWNGNFNNVPCALPGNVTLLQLLTGFFAYYVRFDYKTSVISLFLGKVLNRSCFQLFSNIPKEYVRYKQVIMETSLTLPVDKPLCVQDPFEHNRNVTSVVQPLLLCKFVSLCESALKICEQNSSSILYKLFANTITEKFFIVQSTIQYNLKVDPFECCLNNTIKTLQGICRIKVSMKDTANNGSKQIRLAGANDVHCDGIKNKAIIEATAREDTWSNRTSLLATNLKEIVQTGYTEFDKEVSLTNYMVVRNLCPILMPPIEFELLLVEKEEAQYSIVDYTLSGISPNTQSFNAMTSFLRTKIKEIVLNEK